MGDITTTRAQLNTSTGTQDITVSGFGTPSAAIVILQEVAANDTITSDAKMSIGATDGTTDVVNYIQSRDLSSTSSTNRRTATGILGVIYNNSSTVVHQCSFDSWVTDGIRINNTTAASDIFATVILFKNVQADVFLEQMLTTSESVTVGFEADLVFMLSTGNSAVTYGVNAISSFGIAHNDGTDANYGQFYFDRDSQSTTQTGSYISNTYSFGQYFNDTLSWGGSVGSYTSTGFTLTANTSTGNDYVVGLAIKFNNATNISLGIVDSPAATGAVNYDSAGFTPDFGLYLTTKNTAVDTVQTVARQSIGVWSIDSNSYQSNAYFSDDAASTTDAVSLVSDSKLKDLTSSIAAANDGTFVGFDANGFDFNFTTVSSPQRKWIELAIGAAAGGTITVTGATSTYSYTAQTATVDLTGAISVTGQTPSYSYAAVSASIDLTPEITVTGATATYSYSAINGVVELGAVINVTGQTPNYSYSAQNATVTLQGAINVTGQTTSYSYTAIRAAVQVGKIATNVSFVGTVKVSEFLGALPQLEFSGTIKQQQFSGEIKQAASFIGARK